MLNEDEDALICDLAETYHVFNLEALPVKLLATLSCGLRDDSRIKMKLAGQKVDTRMMIQAYCADSLGMIAWSKTKDAKHGKNRPKSVLDMLTRENEKEAEGFTSGEEFERAKARILERME